MLPPSTATLEEFDYNPNPNEFDPMSLIGAAVSIAECMLLPPSMTAAAVTLAVSAPIILAMGICRIALEEFTMVFPSALTLMGTTTRELVATPDGLVVKLTGAFVFSSIVSIDSSVIMSMCLVIGGGVDIEIKIWGGAVVILVGVTTVLAAP